MRLIDADKVSEYLKNLFKGYVADGYTDVNAADCSAMVQCVVRGN